MRRNQCSEASGLRNSQAGRAMLHPPELAVAVKEWHSTLNVAVVLIASQLTQGRDGRRISRFGRVARCYIVWRQTAVSKFDDLLERTVLGLAGEVPGRIVAAVALLLYPGAGLLLPLVLHWSRWGLVQANVLGTLLAAVVTLGWLIVQIEARDRRHLVEWTTNLRLLNPEEFEWLVGELFRREGWNVRETGHQESADGNIDLVLTRGGLRRIVQCKRWNSWLVGVEDIRGFA